uniref:Tubulin delta chain n=1 Tax=Bracon brevicornis TaxID=1563983 RepID=A0A6V7I764_9HYME
MLTLQFGQCGNQLGDVLFKKITKDIQSTSPGTSFSDCYDYVEAATAKWFEGVSQDGRKIARVILVDTEKKVINKVISKTDNNYCYRSKNIINPGNAGGSANNWAYGYSKKGPEFNNSIMEAVRREVERADRVDSFFNLMSCAGGTGSGLGSFIISSLRDEFPLKNIVTVPVLPFTSGEVATQNYNAILSLAKIMDDSDLIIMMENQRLNQELFHNQSGRKIDFPNDLNDIASQKLLSIFQPAQDISSERTNQVNHIISKVSPHPGYKLVNIEAAPLVVDAQGTQRTVDSFQGHFRDLKKEISHPRGIKSLSNILITRGTHRPKGKNIFHPNNDDPRAIEPLVEKNLFSKLKWLQFEERMTHFHQKRSFLGREKFSSVITNNSRMSRPLEDILANAWDMYTHGAFLHQYKQYGLEEDDFLRAFAKIESTAKSYKSLERE